VEWSAVVCGRTRALGVVSIRWMLRDRALVVLPRRQVLALRGTSRSAGGVLGPLAAAGVPRCRVLATRWAAWGAGAALSWALLLWAPPHLAVVGRPPRQHLRLAAQLGGSWMAAAAGGAKACKRRCRE
jgi:hypothetical protein